MIKKIIVNTTGARFWENIQLLVLAMTIAGQIIMGSNYIIAQSIWLIANCITITRDFVLKRPAADKIKNICLTAITAGLIIIYWMGAFH